MKTRTATTVCAIGLLSAAGCGLQKNRPATVLRSSDFVVDPTTTPTQAAAAPPVESPGGGVAEGEVEAPAVSVGNVGVEPPPAAPAIGASDGAFNVSATAGGPDLSGPEPGSTGGPVLVEAKVGEINGRPVRVQDVFEVVGGRLDAAARTRRISEQDWALLRQRPQDREISRQEWLAMTERLFSLYLQQIMEDELLEAEARASLKPEQQMGLRYLVQEFGEQQRREAGGSQAALSRRLSERGRTLEQAKREREMILLIQYQLEEKIRVRVSWKDVRLWYERNFEVFNPPATATFRMIQVRADDAEAVARVEAALASGAGFEEVASGGDNFFERDKGGMWGEKQFTGEYAQAELFSEPLNTVARSLEPRKWAGPVDFGGARTWLYLEGVKQDSQPLSDRDVQLRIANELNRSAFQREQERYIERLKTRASFSDLNEMTRRLTEIAARRYWPE
jgi:hypothetical protein